MLKIQAFVLPGGMVTAVVVSPFCSFSRRDVNVAMGKGCAPAGAVTVFVHLVGPSGSATAGSTVYVDNVVITPTS